MKGKLEKLHNTSQQLKEFVVTLSYSTFIYGTSFEEERFTTFTVTRIITKLL